MRLRFLVFLFCLIPNVSALAQDMTGTVWRNQGSSHHFLKGGALHSVFGNGNIAIEGTWKQDGATVQFSPYSPLSFKGTRAGDRISGALRLPRGGRMRFRTGNGYSKKATLERIHNAVAQDQSAVVEERLAAKRAKARQQPPRRAFGTPKEITEKSLKAELLGRQLKTFTIGDQTVLIDPEGRRVSPADFAKRFAGADGRIAVEYWDGDPQALTIKYLAAAATRRFGSLKSLSADKLVISGTPKGIKVDGNTHFYDQQGKPISADQFQVGELVIVIQKGKKGPATEIRKGPSKSPDAKR